MTGDRINGVAPFRECGIGRPLEPLPRRLQAFWLDARSRCVLHAAIGDR